MKNVTPKGKVRKVNKKVKNKVIKKDKEIKDKKALATVDPEKTELKKKVNVNSIQLNDPNTLIQSALENNVGVEQLNALMEMKYRHEDREAEKTFHKYFSQMQSEFPVVKKKKDVDGAYKYAPIEDLIKEVLPSLKKYGFSYRWTEESIKDNWKRIYCHISGYGHTEKSFIDIPIIGGNKYANAIQQVGASSSYGRRYSLLSALGIVTEDEDTDANIPEDKEKDNLIAIIKENAHTLGLKSWAELDKKAGVKIAEANKEKLREISKQFKKEVENKLKGNVNNKVDKKPQNTKPEKTIIEYLDEAEKLSKQLNLKPVEFDAIVKKQCPNGVNINGLKNVIKKLNSDKQGNK